MKKSCIIAIIILLSFIFSFSAYANNGMPYNNYTYTEDSLTTIEGPQAYTAEIAIYGKDLGIGDFSGCNDIFSDNNGEIYVLDSGNNRVVVINADYSLNRVININSIVFNGKPLTIEGALGIFVDDDYIYICDTEHSRIILLKALSGDLVKIINAPVSNILGNDFLFQPKSLVADSEKDLYVVSNGTYEGIINMNLDGDFLCFFASNKVTSSSWDLFWRRFSTKEQRKTMEQLVPQAFSNIDIDDSSFFFVTTSTAYNKMMVKRINPGGNNVIRSKSNVPIMGDPSKVINGSLKGNSSFCDIASGNYKIYACLDSTRGKIFCYNNDGYLLYTFGTLCEQFGGFRRPVALTYISEDKIAVLDAESLAFTVFSPTEYAKAVNKGTDLQNRLEYDNAIEQWEKVIKLNGNFQLAKSMVGKSYFNSGDYKTAMKYFKSADNKDMYSAAKKSMRSEWIHKNAKYIIPSIGLLVIFIFVLTKFLYKIKKESDNDDE